jgi:glyoxylase-like metal-dependent hydrolase (beta-lactamase superfamily II)
LAAAVLALSGGTGAKAPAEPPQAERRADLLAAAANSLGSARDRAAASRLEAEQSGTYYAVEQARSPLAPIVAAGRAFRWRYDAGRLTREARQTYPGGVTFHSRTALGGEGGWSVDLIGWRTGTDLVPVAAAEALATRLQWERFFPHLLVAQAEAAGAAATTEGSLRFRDAAGAEIELWLDPVSGRPVRAVQAPAGNVPRIEMLYGDYVRRHGVMMPGRVRLLLAGRVQEDLRLGATRIAPLAEAALAPPRGYAPPPAPGEAGAREIAPGVLFFENMPGDYHSLAIDAGNHMVLVEAPLSRAYAAAQRRILEALRPGKPVRFVLVTHHHGDHVGGLSAWAEAGATIVVPAGARVAIERQLRARGFAGTLRIEEVTGRRSFAGGRLDAHAFASSHAEAHLIAHLPQPRILFQGDLFYLPARGGPPPAFPLVADPRDRIAALGLEVESIAGVHGRIATRAEYEESLRLGGRTR